MSWAEIIAWIMYGATALIGVIGGYAMLKPDDVDRIRGDHLATQINEHFKGELENHVRECGRCDPIDNMCPVGEDICQRWKTALAQVIQDSIED